MSAESVILEKKETVVVEPSANNTVGSFVECISGGLANPSGFVRNASSERTSGVTSAGESDQTSSLSKRQRKNAKFSKKKEDVSYNDPRSKFHEGVAPSSNYDGMSGVRTTKTCSGYIGSGLEIEPVKDTQECETMVPYNFNILEGDPINPENPNGGGSGNDPAPSKPSILDSPGLNWLYYWIHGGGSYCQPGKCFYGRGHFGSHMSDMYSEESLQQMTTLGDNGVTIARTHHLKLKQDMTMSQLNKWCEENIMLTFDPLLAYRHHKNDLQWRYYCVRGDKYLNFYTKMYYTGKHNPYFAKMDTEILLKMRNNSRSYERIELIESVLDARKVKYEKLQMLEPQTHEVVRTKYDEIKDYFMSFCKNLPGMIGQGISFVTGIFESAWSAVSNVVQGKIDEYIKYCFDGVKYLLVGALAYVLVAYAGCKIVSLFINGAAALFGREILNLLPKKNYQDQSSLVDVVNVVVASVVMMFAYFTNIGITDLTKKASSITCLLNAGSKIPSLSKLLVALFSGKGLSEIFAMISNSEYETSQVLTKIQVYFNERKVQSGHHLTSRFLHRCNELIELSRGNLKLTHQHSELLIDKAKLEVNKKLVEGLVPYHIWICGEPGLGKTLIAEEINKLETFHAEAIGCPLKRSIDDEYEQLYVVSNSDSYYSGYSGNNMLYDDVCSMTDANKEKYFKDILYVVSPSVYYLNQASVDDPAIGIKGTIACPTLVIATSNKDTGISSIQQVLSKPDAVMRRRHMTIKVVLKPDFAKFHVKGKNIDFDSLKKENPDFDEKEFQHLDFFILDPATKSTSSNMTYNELKITLLEQWVTHWSNQANIAAKLRDFSTFSLEKILGYQDQSGTYDWSTMVLRNLYYSNSWKDRKTPPPIAPFLKMCGLEQSTYAELVQYYSIYEFDPENICPNMEIRLKGNRLIYFGEKLSSEEFFRRIRIYQSMSLTGSMVIDNSFNTGSIEPSGKIKAMLEGYSYASMETLQHLSRTYKRTLFWPQYAYKNEDFTKFLLVDESNYYRYRDEVYDTSLSSAKMISQKAPEFREAKKETNWLDWFYSKLQSIGNYVKENKMFFISVFAGVAALVLLKEYINDSVTLDYRDEGRPAKRSYQSKRRIMTGPSGGSDDTDANGRQLFGRRLSRRFNAIRPSSDTLEEVERRIIGSGSGLWADYADQGTLNEPQHQMTSMELASLMLGEMMVSQNDKTLAGNFIMPLGRWIIFPLHYLAAHFDTDEEFDLQLYLPRDTKRERLIKFTLNMGDLVLFEETKEDGTKIHCDVVAFNLPANLAQAMKDRRHFFVSEAELPNVGVNGNCIGMFTKKGNQIYHRVGDELEYCIDIAKECIDPDDPEWARTRGFYANLKTSIGDCGSLFSYNFSPSNCKFVSMHTGSFNSNTIAKSCLISKEMLDNLYEISCEIPIKGYTDQAAVFDTQSGLDANGIGIKTEKTGRVEVYNIPPGLEAQEGGIKLGSSLIIVDHLGKTEQSYLPVVNDMLPSLCYKKPGSPWGKPTKFPSNLSRTTPLSTRMTEDGEGSTIDPIANNLNKVEYGKPLKPTVVTTVKSWLKDEILDLGAKVGVKGQVFSEAIAINGIPGMYESLDLNTAAGPLMDKSSEKKLPGKHSFIAGEIGDRKVISKDLRDAIDDMLNLAKQGVRQEIRKSTVADYPKQEKVNPEKIFGYSTLDGKRKTPQVRTFQIGNVHYLILFRRYFGAFQIFFEKCRGYFRHAIGLDPMSGEVPKILEGIKGLKPLDGDYESYDKVASGDLHEGVCEAINAWYMEFDPTCTEEDCRVRRVLYDYVIRCFHQIEGNIYLQTNGIPSGFLFTAVANCMLNWLLLAYCFVEITPSAMKADWDRVFKIFMGDDNFLGIPSEFSNYNGIGISEVLKKHGISYTPAAKGESVFNLNKKLEDCEFIKHNPMILKDGNIILKPQLSSINNGLQYCNKTTRNNPHLYVPLFIEVLLKTFLHGEDVYNDYRKHLVEVLKENKISGSLPTYKEAYRAMIERYEGVTLLQELKPRPTVLVHSQKC